MSTGTNLDAIDFHNHFYPRAFLEAAERRPEVCGARIMRGADGQPMMVYDIGFLFPLTRHATDLDDRMTVMDAAGIDKLLLSMIPLDLRYTAPVDAAREFCRIVNDGLAETARQYPDRILPTGTLPLQDPAAARRELERCVNELGMAAVQIGPIIAGQNLDEPRFLEFFEAAAALEVGIFIHPSHTVPGPGLGRHYLANFIGNPLDTTIAAASLIFGGVLDRLPDLRICLAHGGGTVPFLAGRWRHGARVRLEPKVALHAPFDEQLRRLYFDSLTHSGPALEFLVRTVGSDRVVVGTDYPADMGNTAHVAEIGSLHSLTAEDAARILYGNAPTFLPRAREFLAADGA